MNPRTVSALLRTAFSRPMLEQLRLAAISHAKAEQGTCPACGYQGRFNPFGMPVRSGAMCPKCWSLERQRLLVLAIQRREIAIEGRDIVHFAAETSVRDTILRHNPRSYRISDFATPDHDLQLDLENLDLPGASLDVVIANHILEHVDDRRALSEIHRVLRPGGELICMIPIVEGWEETYENATITSPVERERHFGQFDHVRFYGRDFRNRTTEAGFALREITANPSDVLRYRLQRGEKVFVCLKQPSEAE